MKFHKEENGYALLIVLFIIVFITVVSAVFIRGAIGNAKQEVLVDDSHLSVTAAEAGVDFYKTELSNLYYSKVPDLEEFIISEIDRFKLNEEEINFVKIRENTVEELERCLQTEKKSLTKEKTINGYSFTLDGVEVIGNTSKSNVKVEGVVTGHGLINDTTASISFVILLTVPEIILGSPNDEESDSSGKDSIEFDIYNLYKEPPTSLNECRKGNSIKDGSNCKSNSSNSGIVDEIKQNSTVYFPQGRWGIGTNIEIKDNSTVFINDKLGTEKLDVKDSTVFINGSLSVYAKSEIKDNSLFALNGSTVFYDELAIKNHANVFLRGSNHFHKDLVVKNNANLCIAGSAKVENELIIKSGGSVYVYKEKNDSGIDYKKIEGKLSYVNSMQELYEKCSVNSKENVYEQSIWKDPIITDADYN